MKYLRIAAIIALFLVFFITPLKELPWQIWFLIFGLTDTLDNLSNPARLWKDKLMQIFLALAFGFAFGYVIGSFLPFPMLANAVFFLFSASLVLCIFSNLRRIAR